MKFALTPYFSYQMLDWEGQPLRFQSSSSSGLINEIIALVLDDIKPKSVHELCAFVKQRTNERLQAAGYKYQIRNVRLNAKSPLS